MGCQDAPKATVAAIHSPVADNRRLSENCTLGKVREHGTKVIGAPQPYVLLYFTARIGNFISVFGTLQNMLLFLY